MTENRTTLRFLLDMAKFIACFALVVGCAMAYLTIAYLFGLLWGAAGAAGWVIGSMVIGAAALTAAFERANRNA